MGRIPKVPWMLASDTDTKSRLDKLKGGSYTSKVNDLIDMYELLEEIAGRANVPVGAVWGLIRGIGDAGLLPQQKTVPVTVKLPEVRDVPDMLPENHDRFVYPPSVKKISGKIEVLP